jgi:hypothetical protein
MSELPDRVHHFSWHTRVSLELPVGFETQTEDGRDHVAVYADDLDEGDPPGARVQTRLTAVPESDGGQHLRLAEAACEVTGSEPLERQAIRLDGLPAVEQTLRYHEPRLGTDVVRHEAYAQAGNVVFSIVCMTAAQRQEEYLPAFREAVASARVVLT